MSQSPSGLSRRSIFAGASTVGALAAVASLTTPSHITPQVQQAELPPAPEKGGGYSLSEHVKCYYRTTRV